MPQVVAAVSAFAAASAVNAFIVQIGISLAVSFVARTLFRPSAASVRPAELIRELAIPNSRPPYRFVYGRYRMYGSPAPWRVKGNLLFGAIILNSRPSVGGTVKIYLDKRELTSVTGNLYDFAGSGLRGQLPSPAEAFPDGERPQFWLSLGNQTSPPAAILAAAPEFFQATDGWQGRTVLWVAFNAGETEKRGDRWPRVPPELEVEMDWSRVWDPRDPAQDPDDESTWQFSDNHALVLLDALRQNPIRKFNSTNLMLDTYIDAANTSDVLVTKKDGTTEKRYTANGSLIWDGREIEEQVQPIVDSGAGTLVRAGGRLGYLAGVWHPPFQTVTDILADGGIEFQRLIPSRDLPRGITASYVNPDRDWKEADLPIREVPNAPPIIGNDGVVNIKLPFCTSPTQAMRVQKIAAMKAGNQKRLSCVLPPDAFNLLAGANVTLDLPALTNLNGTWELTAVNPGISLAEPDGGVALRVPVQMVETASEVYDWNAATEEFDLATEDFVPTRPAVQPPSDLQAVSGAEQMAGDQPRIRFSFLPSGSGSVTDYEWQWRETGGDYEQGGFIDQAVRDDLGRVFGYLTLVVDGGFYDIRVRSVSINRVSSWIEITSIQAISAPSGPSTSVTSGLVMLAAPGINETNTEYNFGAASPQPVVVGSPAYDVTGLTSDGNDYVDFNVAATGSRTMVFVSYIQSGVNNVPFSAFNPAPSYGEYLEVISGSVRFATVATGSANWPVFTRADNRYEMFAVVIDNTNEIRGYVPRTNEEDIHTTTSNFDLVGREYRTSITGTSTTSKAPLFAFWNRALSNAELEIFYNEMRTYLLSRGLDIS